jgi:chorismate dehydratase
VSGKLRVGIVDYLNSKPLAWSFLAGKLDDRFEALYEPPARVASLLAEGLIDVGLIPSIEYQRIPDLSIIPGLCVAAEREVRSVILVSRVAIPDIRTLALDQNSRTSAVLVQIVLRERYGIEPVAVQGEPDVEAMLSVHDAALLIGDPALKVDRQGLEVLDLAREWRHLTGFPFVFAVWAVRDGVNTAGLVEPFARSLSDGMSHLGTLVTEAATELSLDAVSLREYLMANLHFRLGTDELAGLEEYFSRAKRHGLIESIRPLRLSSG